MKTKELKKLVEDELEKYRTFGSLEDDNFTPVEYFDSYFEYLKFVDAIVKLIKRLSKESH